MFGQTTKNLDGGYMSSGLSKALHWTYKYDTNSCQTRAHTYPYSHKCSPSAIFKLILSENKEAIFLHVHEACNGGGNDDVDDDDDDDDDDSRVGGDDVDKRGGGRG